MKNKIVYISILVITVVLYFTGSNFYQRTKKNNLNNSSQFIAVSQKQLDLSQQSNLEIATFSGGCFWCMEAGIEPAEGVVEVISGFAGGTTENPTYESVIQGETDYREAAQVYFSPEVISYEEVLQLYWSQIDPTDSGGQFSDRGFHYTTAIYYHSSEQKEVSEKSKKVLDKSSVYSKKIVTDILPFTTFFPAEDYHQDYYKNNDRSYDLYAKGSGRKGYIEEGVLADFKWPWQK